MESESEPLVCKPQPKTNDSTSRTRRPYHYGAPASLSGSNDTLDDLDSVTQSAQMARYKYYGRLSGYADALRIPDHIVPTQFFLLVPLKGSGDKQSSIITIFSLWNTMMGTSILTMPWALEQAGFANGVCLLLIMGLITLYTAYRTMKDTDTLANTSQCFSSNTASDSSDQGPPVLDFPDVCRCVLGRWAEWMALVFSLAAMLGAIIVYWVLMSNFLYHTGHFIYQSATGEWDRFIPHDNSTPAQITCGDMVCHASAAHVNTTIQNHGSRLYRQLWHQRHTVPLYLVLLVAPTVNLKSPTFFTKFNSLGTISVMYLLAFLVTKASQCGLNVDMTHSGRANYVPQFSWSFPALTGTLSLAMFSHTAVNSIMRTQRHPQNNARDLSVAYVLVTLTYLTVAVTFYLTFPLSRPQCLQDNLLNNFHSGDMLTVVARVFLLFQMFCVFPLLAYIVRIQALMAIFGSVWPSTKHVVALNAIVITAGVLFAVFYPQVGTIIRFAGALSGVCLVFTLPCLVNIVSTWQRGGLRLTNVRTVLHVAMNGLVVGAGLANFLAQFLIMDDTHDNHNNHN